MYNSLNVTNTYCACFITLYPNFECICYLLVKPTFYIQTKGSLQKKKTEKSDIVQKGRVGWTPKSYF